MKKAKFLMLLATATVLATACRMNEAMADRDHIHDGSNTSTQWVDLGLPSGLLWASHNVGASSPEGYGDYFAWGETQSKSYYDWSTYRWGNGYYELTQYNTRSDYGVVDNLTTLQPSDDAATANWGGGARMPTVEEWDELRQYTTGEWVQVNGAWGQCRTASNGNSIFLPAAGGRWYDELGCVGDDGIYWSSSLGTDSPYVAWDFYFSSGNGRMDSGYGSRSNGHSVRPVRSSGQN